MLTIGKKRSSNTINVTTALNFSLIHSSVETGKKRFSDTINVNIALIHFCVENWGKKNLQIQ